MRRSLALLLTLAAQPLWAEAATPDAAQTIPAPHITVAIVETRPLRDVIIASGLIGAVEQVQVAPLVEGQPIEELLADVGDQVQAGQVLMQLDTRELALEESMAQADVLRYSREAEKAQALRQLADMQITIARRDQSASRLALIRHQLAHAKVTAPQAGVVVEGELKKNLGAPLRKGDLLLKLAQNGDSYLELEIDQSDVHEVRVGSRGEFALVGRPEQRFGIEIDRIDPASTLREGRNVYLARGRVEQTMASWWRPGMGGTARIDAGQRPLIWVMTHRTVRFLREFFWL